MRFLPLALLLISTPAFAQQPEAPAAKPTSGPAARIVNPAPDYQSPAMGDEILDCVTGKVNLRKQILAMKAENDALKKQAQDAKAATDKPKTD